MTIKQENIQYITDHKGKVTAVIVPIEYWRELTADQETPDLVVNLETESLSKDSHLIEPEDKEKSISIERINIKLES